MNKMSFEKLKELFLNKYENGAIFKDNQRKGRMVVCYQQYGKGYSYTYTNYLQLAKRLNLIDDEVKYHKTFTSIEKQIERLNKRLYEVENDIDTFYLLTKEEEIESIKKEIRDMQVLLETSVELA